jgi:hypothetical protein
MNGWLTKFIVITRQSSGWLTAPAYFYVRLKETMNQTKLNHIKFALFDMAFLDIKRASAGESKMGAFILASCFIEYMAGFIAGRETTNKDYKQFVKD